jgi:hypothetical protein
MIPLAGAASNGDATQQGRLAVLQETGRPQKPAAEHETEREWPPRKATTAARPPFAKLHADEILDLHNGAYQASHIALYSSFRVDDPANPSTDKRVIRSTATT